MELLDIPDPDPGMVHYTLSNGMNVQMTKAERDKKMLYAEATGAERVGQLDDPASRPVHYAVLPSVHKQSQPHTT